MKFSTALLNRYKIKKAQRQQLLLPFESKKEYTSDPKEIFPGVSDYAPYNEDDWATGFYHVTTNLPAVLHSGELKSRQQLENPIGLGGGSKNEAPNKISVTHNLDKAHFLYDAMKFAADVAYGRMKPSNILSQLTTGSGIDLWSLDLYPNLKGVLEKLDIPDSMLAEDSDEDIDSWLDENITSPKETYEFMQNLESAIFADTSEEESPSFYAGFTMPFEVFSQINPQNIGIVEVLVRKGAEVEHVPGEQELRFYPKDVMLPQSSSPVIAQKEKIEFHTMLHRGYKGILFNDNTWVTWDSWHTPAFSFEATHKAVHDKYFPNKEILVTAYHAPDSTLYINSGSLNIWDSNVEMVVNKFVGNRGSGSKLIIERSIGGHNHFEGTFREYLEDNPKLRISQKNIEFIDGLPQGSKGILLTDGKWIAWQADYSGFPHHQHVLAEVLHKKFDSVLLSADHSHDDLYIESLTYEPWSSEVTWIVSKYFQSGGNGHIDIFGKSQEFSGDSIEYRRYLTKKRKDL